MADYLSDATLWQLYASCDSVTVCRKNKIVVTGVDTDAFHRKFRIMENLGLMKSKERGSDIEYTATPKAKALCDFIQLTLQASPSPRRLSQSEARLS